MSALIEPLFPVTAEDVALTTDEWYTPRWIFKAAGLTFDLDVCAPVATEFRTCPATRYLTVIEDGLTQPWEGVVWCNPPYTRAAPWVDRWANHPEGLILTLARNEVRWLGQLSKSADALALLSLEFGRPDGSVARLNWLSLLAARGPICTAALARIAQADRYVQGAYQVRPVA